MLIPNQFKATQAPYNLIDPLLRTIVQTVFVRKHRLEYGYQYKAPFLNSGLNAVEKLFSEEELEEILELTKRLIA